MIAECVVHLAGSRRPAFGSGWGVVVRTPAGEVLAQSSGGERGATSYRMELVALLRGLGSVPPGTSRVLVRIANGGLLGCCETYARTGAPPRKARYPELLRELGPLLGSAELRWVGTSGTTRDAWDKQAKALAQGAAVPDREAPAARVPPPSPPPPAPFCSPARAVERSEPPALRPNKGGAARVVAFTDGGCRGNPGGVGGWAFLVVDRHTHAALERRGGERRTTNNRMELLAAIHALEAVRSGEQVEVRSDSQYLVNMCSRWMPAWKARGWKRKENAPIQNLDLVQRLDALMATRQVRWTWVRGHSGVKGNEHVDRLASKAMDLVQAGQDPLGERRYAPGMSPVRVAKGSIATAASAAG